VIVNMHARTTIKTRSICSVVCVGVQVTVLNTVLV
jgi:hypothetical protein